MVNFKFFFITLFTLSTNCIAQPEFYELKGVKIGDTFESIDLGNFRCAKSALNKNKSEFYSLEHITLANKKVDIKVTFHQSLADSITAFFDHDDYTDIREAFLLKYGKPSEEETETLTNGFGAEFNSTKTLWKSRSQTATIIEMVNNKNSSMMTIYSDDHIKRYSNEKFKKAKENSNDL